MNASEKAYQAVSRVANPTNSEGLKKPRSILLLWFLRNVFGIDDLEAYEFVCDGDNDQGFDALFLEEPDEGGRPAILHVFQSKYPETAKNVGVNDLKHFVGSAAVLDSIDAFDGLLREDLEPELKKLLHKFRIRERLSQNLLHVSLTFVTAGTMTADAKRYADGVNKTKKRTYLDIYDARRLEPIVEAFSTPTTVKALLELDCDANSRFLVKAGDAQVMVAAVKAQDVVTWPGIDDRTLFDLNVRRELRLNPVRKALDRAIARSVDHANFLAFHNGLTVVCEKIDFADASKVKITNLSVVNGAQSTVAFHAHQALLSPELRVVVKFVEVSPDAQLAREVAIRSNTQNPVTNRNLRARDGIQLRLVSEFAAQYPEIAFETRPDFSNPPSGAVIHNDLAAQWLCALFNEQPWLAVKRLSLFDSETYPVIYHKNITAAHVVLASRIAQLVESTRSDVPETYQKSWQLTKLVAIYIVGQILRTETRSKSILEQPAQALASPDLLAKRLKQPVQLAVAALKLRVDEKARSQIFDDFKVEFKREASLKELAAKAREYALIHKVMNNSDTASPNPAAAEKSTSKRPIPKKKAQTKK